jgi:methyl-accepting chemotaxis protein
MLENMTIKTKSILLMGIFVIILLINAIGTFIGTTNVKNANKKFELETEKVMDFSHLKYLLRALQETATDTTLMGDGFDRLPALKKEYEDAVKEMKGMDFSKDDYKNLAKLNSHFDAYYNALSSMAQAGVKRAKARNLSKKIMKKFDDDVTIIENDLKKIIELPENISLRIQLYVIQTQEVLTDALAVGDKQGIVESIKMRKDFVQYLNKIAKKYPKSKSDLMKLEKDFIALSKQGGILASRGVKFEEMTEQVNKDMLIVDKTSAKIKDIINNIQKMKQIELSKIMANTDNTIGNLKTTVVILSILFVIGIIILFVILQDIVLKITNFQIGLLNFFKYLNRKVNDVEPLNQSGSDEISAMAKVVNKNIETIKFDIEQDSNLIKEVETVMARVNNGWYSQKLTLPTSNVQLNRLKENINNMLDNTKKRFIQINQLLEEYTHENYTKKLVLDGIEKSGVYDTFIKDINILRDTITTMLVENKQNGTALQSSANNLLNNVSSLSSASNQAAASLEETAAAIEQITSNISNNTHNIVQMASHGNEVKSSVSKGQKLATQTTEAMDNINNEVSSISEAIAVIDQIAFQTNILSLNAAVEAATAGEAGKGFAVVAQEVRNLASRSAEAANEIKTLVENATAKASKGKQISDEMIDGYTHLNISISKTLELIQDVETASKEQLHGIEQINHAVTELDQQTQQNANVASSTQNIAVDTKNIAKTIVDDVNQKEFEGK